MRTELSLILILSFGTGLIQAGCSLAQTRPVQEMSNAEIALQAAKDLNADSLVPDTYRAATDHYFKAKKEYRLKNFDKAKLHALKAMKLAEKAEFEAYRLGGATPEISSGIVSPEGSSTDSERAFNEGSPQDHEHGKQHQENAPPPEDAGPPPPPEGQTGPTPLANPGKRQVTIEYPAKLEFQDKALPQNGSLPPTTSGVPQSLVERMNSPTQTTKTKIQDYDYQLLQSRLPADTPNKDEGDGLPDLGNSEIPEIKNEPIKNLFERTNQ